MIFKLPNWWHPLLVGLLYLTGPCHVGAQECDFRIGSDSLMDGCHGPVIFSFDDKFGFAFRNRDAVIIGLEDRTVLKKVSLSQSDYMQVFFPNGSDLVLISNDGRLSIFDWKLGLEKRHQELGTDIEDISISPSGNCLAVFKEKGEKQKVVIVNLDGEVKTRDFEQLDFKVDSVEFLSEGVLRLSGFAEKDLIHPDSPESSIVINVVFLDIELATMKTSSTISDDLPIDVAGLKIVNKATTVLECFDGETFVVLRDGFLHYVPKTCCDAVSSNKANFGFASLSERVDVFDASNGVCKSTFNVQGSIEELTVSNSGRFVSYVSDLTGRTRVRDLQLDEFLTNPKIQTIKEVAWIDNETLIVNDGVSIQSWRIDENELLWKVDFRGSIKTDGINIFAMEHDESSSFNLKPRVSVFSASHGQSKFVIPGAGVSADFFRRVFVSKSNPIGLIEYIRDGKYRTAVSNFGEFEMKEIESQRDNMLIGFNEQMPEPYSVFLSEEGFEIVQLNNEEEVVLVPGKDLIVHSDMSCLGTQGAFLVSSKLAPDDFKLYLLDFGAKTIEVSEVQDVELALTFSPNKIRLTEELVFVLTPNGKLTPIDVTTGRKAEQMNFRPGQRFTDIAVSPDFQSIAVGSSDGKVEIFSLKRELKQK